MENSEDRQSHCVSVYTVKSRGREGHLPRAPKKDTKKKKNNNNNTKNESQFVSYETSLRQGGDDGCAGGWGWGYCKRYPNAKLSMKCIPRKSGASDHQTRLFPPRLKCTALLFSDNAGKFEKYIYSGDHRLEICTTIVNNMSTRA